MQSMLQMKKEQKEQEEQRKLVDKFGKAILFS
jgi:hypothetical protein